jgi:hypothetical protein
MQYLKRGLRMLKAKGIHVILDFHALPGVASANQMFAGRCTTDVQFYVSYGVNSNLFITHPILSDGGKLQAGLGVGGGNDRDDTHGRRL